MAKSLRVAILAPLHESVPPRLYGGTERVVASLCHGLAQEGVDVTLFASGDSFAPAQLYPVIDEALRLRKKEFLEPEAYNFKMLATVASHAHEFDVIHNHHGFWMLPLTEMTKTPFVTTYHGRLDAPEIIETLSSYPKGSFISVSDAQRMPAPNLPWLRTVYHGLDTNLFEYHPEPGKYLAFLGRITPEKRVDWAIEIARLSGVPLKIAAKIENGRDREYFDTYIKKEIDDDFIQFVGEISDAQKSDFLGNALALVFPIDCLESFGLVCVESLATGTPVLARPLGAITEILKDGVTGYIHADIAKLAKRVVNIPAISRQECRRWVERRFSLARMTKDYLAAYREMTATPPIRALA